MMKIQKLKETANILLDLEILCKQYNKTHINFKILEDTMELYGSHEFLYILNDNFRGSIEADPEYSQKFVIEL